MKSIFRLRCYPFQDEISNYDPSGDLSAVHANQLSFLSVNWETASRISLRRTPAQLLSFGVIALKAQQLQALQVSLPAPVVRVNIVEGESAFLETLKTSDAVAFLTLVEQPLGIPSPVDRLGVAVVFSGPVFPPRHDSIRTVRIGGRYFLGVLYCLGISLSV